MYFFQTVIENDQRIQVIRVDLEADTQELGDNRIESLG